MAAIAPVEIDPHEWLLLRNLSFEEFKLFMTDVEDLGLWMARRRLRLKYANQFPATGAQNAD